MEEGNHSLTAALAHHRNSYINLLKKVRVHVADFHMKGVVLDWIWDCRLYADRCRDTGLQILNSGGELQKTGDGGEAVISKMTPADVLDIYRERAERLDFFEAKVNATHGSGIRITPGGGLGGDEDVVKGWHTLDRHVNKTLEDLALRLSNNPKMKAASAFTSREAAEEAAGKAVAYYEEEIRGWLAGGKVDSPLLEVTKDRIVIKDFEADSVVGYVLSRGRSFAEYTSRVRIVLAKEPTSLTKYRIKTGYPVP